jgi:hypothetical protein
MKYLISILAIAVIAVAGWAVFSKSGLFALDNGVSNRDLLAAPMDGVAFGGGTAPSQPSKPGELSCDEWIKALKNARQTRDNLNNAVRNRQSSFTNASTGTTQSTPSGADLYRLRQTLDNIIANRQKEVDKCVDKKR